MERKDPNGSGPMQPGETRISVRSLTKRFMRRGGGGEVIPVNNISLDVAADEMVVLLGPSGCGKTTLLRCIAGLEEPDEGEIIINGQVVFSSEKGIFTPPNLRPISMVFQSYALWPHMSVYENVAYPLQSRGVRSSEIKERVMQVLGLVDLAPLAGQYPGQISGGQQQRVALARAVVSGTGVVLFDEPLSNVDAKVREQLRSEIVRMQRKLGFSALYVTHDQIEAMAIGDRIAVLHDGQIEQMDTPQQIYTRPANRRVGTFIGSPNVLESEVIAVGADGVTVRTAIGDLSVRVQDEGAHRRPLPGGKADVLIRPETISLALDKPAMPENCIQCSIETRFFLGAYTEYTVAASEGSLRVWSFGSSNLAEGSNAWLSVSASDLVLLGSQD